MKTAGRITAERWPLLVNAIRAKYPDMKLIATSSLQDGGHPMNPSAGHCG